MGLVISRTIIENHGGKLWACPQDGGGAALHIDLPARPER
jgi:two-component system sensor kinase FixL